MLLGCRRGSRPAEGSETASGFESGHRRTVKESEWSPCSAVDARIQRCMSAHCANMQVGCAAGRGSAGLDEATRRGLPGICRDSGRFPEWSFATRGINDETDIQGRGGEYGGRSNHWRVQRRGAVCDDCGRSDPAQLMSGVVLDGQGNGLEGVSVAVRIEDRRPGVTDLTTLGRTATDEEGHFNIGGALGNAPHTTNEDGSVPLEVMTLHDGEERFFNINAMPPTPGRPAWTWNAGPNPAYLPPQASERAGQALTNLQLVTDNQGAVTTLADTTAGSADSQNWPGSGSMFVRSATRP